MSGTPVGALLAGLSEDERSRIRQADVPEWTQPMLATLTHEPFSDAGWIYERKLDGLRLLVFRQAGSVRLVTRNRKERSSTWPDVTEALASADGVDLVADGEMVAFEGGVTSFSRLQERMQIRDPQAAREMAQRVRAFLYLFDLLHVDGHDLTGLALRTRKKLLRRAVAWRDPVRFTPHRNETGVAYLREACEKGWEGLIAKRADGAYVHGRSRSWLKLKCVNRQEFVVGGWTDPQGERIGLGALLVGYHEGGALRYAGKVGTGYDDETLRRLSARLEALERDGPAFADADDLPRNDVHWAEPELVCEVGFSEWTEDDKLRHPRYLGLRDDKAPGEVVRERAEARPEGAR
jgi:bifunctional non-homologous end joining protein LigD